MNRRFLASVITCFMLASVGGILAQAPAQPAPAKGAAKGGPASATAGDSSAASGRTKIAKRDSCMFSAPHLPLRRAAASL